jgi:predicted HAD superfamily Cof-like phosphohydrolase
MNSWQKRVMEFHEKFGCTVGQTPVLRDGDLRSELIWEEAEETEDAVFSQDLAKAVDGLVDTIYVCLGAAVAWGVDLEPIFNAVHRANMAKAGGATRDDGKILKPEGWQPPDIAGELRKQGWNG